ncbi:hypothetical protein [Shimia sp. MMG029]|uniref:hypothetical protein n=1 Tax=Shimia sp. MMG029 TaxID=3021978 RepID=UPI0022FE133B|nr:hypothetical protein [Shimia sp. MMG029]MDA5556947.1 hypothetical protein [Shimia sp. MMG029]
MTQRKLLIVAPDVFSILNSVVSFFESRGFDVVFLDDRNSQGFIRNVILRFLRSFYFALFSREIDSRIEKIADDFDKIVIINGEGYDIHHLLEILKKGEQVSFYTWDSVNNKKYLKHFFEVLGDKMHFIGTFDKIDSEKFNICYKPLFSAKIDKPASSTRYQYSFIGTMHSERLKFIYDFLRDGKQDSTQVYVALYCKNIATYLFHMMMNLGYLRAYVSLVKIGFLPLSDFEKIMSASEIVLDYSHPKQAGLTHRCVTALRNGKKVLTNNPNLANSKTVDLNGREYFLITPTETEKAEFSIENWASKF